MQGVGSCEHLELPRHSFEGVLPLFEPITGSTLAIERGCELRFVLPRLRIGDLTRALVAMANPLAFVAAPILAR